MDIYTEQYMHHRHLRTNKTTNAKNLDKIVVEGCS